MQPVHVGGSFAPPLTDEKLASYKSMAEALPPSPVRDGMLALHACVSHWWTLPDSKGQKTPHPSGMGAIIPLDAEHQHAIWELIPWEHELAGMSQVFDSIEKDATLRNSDKIVQWQNDVRAAIIRDEFPKPSVFYGLLKLLHSAGEWLGLLTDNSRAEMEANFKKVQEVRILVGQHIAAKDYDEAHPYPTLEPTPVRDAAHMLLWHVKELDLDREPITTDKL